MYHAAKIIRRSIASPTVVILDLHVPTLSSFLPGQWVDFVVQPYTWIGGFSVASSPKDLPRLTLAIKNSKHAPSIWVHEESKIGQDVEIQVGGTCVLPPISSPIEELLQSPARVFLAGGIGISPVLSQYREFLDQRASITTVKETCPPTKFLYCVSHEHDLVLADELVYLAKSDMFLDSIDTMHFSITQGQQWSSSAYSRYGHPIMLSTGRMMRSFLSQQPQNSIFYLCGPPGMLDDAATYLKDGRGVDPRNIQYEKWW